MHFCDFTFERDRGGVDSHGANRFRAATYIPPRIVYPSYV